MANSTLQTWAAILLAVGGLVHLIPQLYVALADLTGGTPIIQIGVGMASLVVAVVIYRRSRQVVP